MIKGTLLEKQSLEDLWTHWMILFVSAIIIYAFIYQYVFRRQLSYYTSGASQSVPTQNGDLNEHTDTKLSSVHEETETPKQQPENIPSSDANEAFCPERCMLFANVSVSTINAVICSLSSLFLFYAPYWDDPIYGTAIPVYYVTAVTQAYFIVDLTCEVVVYLKYELPRFRWDTLLHHGSVLIYMFWILIPEPIYAWIVTEIAIAMEFSTIFLNASFFAKWYHAKETTIHNIKMGFVLMWFLVRVPGSIAILVWIILFAERILKEYPHDKFGGIIFISTANVIIQGVWTVMIIRKLYRTFVQPTCTSADDQADAESPAPVPGMLNLKRTNSMEITNVTSEA
eukprot:166117_1